MTRRTGAMGRSPSLRAAPRLDAPRRWRNLRLLCQAAAQHLVDDPALLAVQVSRRLPFPLRVRIGTLLEQAAMALPGVGALGAMMAGHDEAAVTAIERADRGRSSTSSRLAGEVAVLLDRQELLPPAAPATTRARAAWARGDLQAAVEILEQGGAGGTRYCRRLRSELALLAPGAPAPGSSPRDAGPDPDETAGRPLRVLHLLTNSLPHTQSGYSLRSHRILTALRAEGIESVALTRTGYPVMVGVIEALDEDVVDDIRYHRTLPETLPRTQEERVLCEVEAALRLVDQFRPDVLHATTNYLNALVAQAVAERTGLPWVLEVRGLMEQTWVASHSTEEGRREAALSQKARMVAAREAELARSADGVVTLSRTMAEELASRGVDRARITLVPNGVDAGLLEGGVAPAAARAELGLVPASGIPEDAVLIGAASALVEYEGFDVLLRSAALVVEDGKLPRRMRDRLHVVLVGDGTARPALVALAEQLGIADRVHMPGRVSRAEVRRWIEALDTVVVPRLDLAVSRLVTPQKPIEALALGRPAVVSDLPALREVLTAPDGTPCARFVEPGSSEDLAHEIARILTQGTGEDLAATGRDLARRQTWTEQVRRYREVYEQMMVKHGGGAPDDR